MKTVITGSLRNNIYNLMRDAGYHFQREENTTSKTEYSFVRPRIGFPRFHIYATMVGKDLSISLHLDQKKPVYSGSAAHSGDYDEPVVAREMERIKQVFENSNK